MDNIWDSIIQISMCILAFIILTMCIGYIINIMKLIVLICLAYHSIQFIIKNNELDLKNIL